MLIVLMNSGNFNSYEIEVFLVGPCLGESKCFGLVYFHIDIKKALCGVSFMAIGSVFYGLVDFILNIDVHLDAIVQQYGLATYIILFLIIFLETGIVVTPFLPGDSLIFVAGAIAAKGSLDIVLLFLLLSFSAVLGDTVNYWIGSAAGKKIYERELIVKREHILKTQEFYDKHGGKAIIFARFVPIIRTIAPFVAGVGKMKYSRFFAFNVIGAILWVALFGFGGYFFGNIPFVERNLSIFIIAIILISIAPPIFIWIRNKLRK